MVVTDLPLASLIGVWQERHGVAVEVDGARAAGRNAAAEFRARQSEHVAKIPEQRHRRIAVEGLSLAIDMQSEHLTPPCPTDRRAVSVIRRYPPARLVPLQC